MGEVVAVGFGWIDIVVAVLALLCLILGYKLGIVRVGVVAVALYVAVIVAAQFGTSLAAILMESFEFVNTQSLANLLAYASIYIGFFIVATILSSIIRMLLRAVFLGWVDKLGGLILGFGLAVGAFSGLLIGVVSTDLNLFFLSCSTVSSAIQGSYTFGNVFLPIWDATSFLHGLLPQDIVVERITQIVESPGTICLK